MLGSMQAPPVLQPFGFGLAPPLPGHLGLAAPVPDHLGLAEPLTQHRSFKEQTSQVVGTMATAMATFAHAEVDCIEDRRGWSIIARVKPEDFWLSEQIITCAKHATLCATEASQSVYVMGYKTRPFRAKPHGFGAMLGILQDESEACWDVYCTGHCERGTSCRWQHPPVVKRLYVVVRADYNAVLKAGRMEVEDEDTAASEECQGYPIGDIENTAKKAEEDEEDEGEEAEEPTAATTSSGDDEATTASSGEDRADERTTAKAQLLVHGGGNGLGSRKKKGFGWSQKFTIRSPH